MTTAAPEPFEVPGPDGSGQGPLRGELLAPSGAQALLLLAHGAGAGYQHATLVAISAALAEVGIASARYNLPFMEAGRRRVDDLATSVAAIAAAATTVTERRPDLPLFAGGHSFGGRMTTHAAARGLIAPRGLVCMSFPLHPANRPGTTRAAHLAQTTLPMLFLSGTRDALADPDLMRQVTADLGPRATLHWLEDADHGYKVRKRVRRDPRPVFQEMADVTARFVSAWLER